MTRKQEGDEVVHEKVDQCLPEWLGSFVMLFSVSLFSEQKRIKLNPIDGLEIPWESLDIF